MGMPIREWNCSYDAGLTRMDGICGATRHAAFACGQGDEIGTLESGKLADILILDGDPLVDLHAFLQIRDVILDGTVVSHLGK